MSETIEDAKENIEEVAWDDDNIYHMGRVSADFVKDAVDEAISAERERADAIAEVAREMYSLLSMYQKEATERSFRDRLRELGMIDA